MSLYCLFIVLVNIFFPFIFVFSCCVLDDVATADDDSDDGNDTADNDANYNNNINSDNFRHVDTMILTENKSTQ